MTLKWIVDEKFEIDVSELDRKEKIEEFNKISIKDEYQVKFSDEFVHSSYKLLVERGHWEDDSML